MELKPINQANYMDCIQLKVHESQEYFVANNAHSLLEAIYEEGIFVRAIYREDQMIGMVLYDYDLEIPGWSMSRFMIDCHYQGQGLGRQALEIFLDFFKNTYQVDRLYTSVSIENTAAKNLYQSAGFKVHSTFHYEFQGKTYQEERLVLAL